MSPKSRSKANYKRRAAFVEPRKTVLIVCEGKNTEPRYFEKLRDVLRLKTAEIEIVGEGCGNSPTSVVKYAVNRVEKHKSARRAPEFDEVWCVIDVEAPLPHADLQTAINLATSKKISLALTNPCFEYWLLLHIRQYGKPYKSSPEAKKILKDECKKHPSITAKNPSTFVDSRQTAITNAELEKKNRHWSNLITDNPSTAVHKLVLSLQAISDQAKPY